MSVFPSLIEQYAAGPALLRQAIAGMTPAQLVAKPIPKQWSTLGVVAHIADFEPVLADRMMRVISHERPLLLVADENLFAATTHYDERNVDEELAVIAAIRVKMTRLLKALPAETANRVGVHSFKGLVSLEAILTAAVNHIPHHVGFVEQKRKALGV